MFSVFLFGLSLSLTRKCYAQICETFSEEYEILFKPLKANKLSLVMILTVQKFTFRVMKL